MVRPDVIGGRSWLLWVLGTGGLAFLVGFSTRALLEPRAPEVRAAPVFQGNGGEAAGGGDALRAEFAELGRQVESLALAWSAHASSRTEAPTARAAVVADEAGAPGRGDEVAPSMEGDRALLPRLGSIESELETIGARLDSLEELLHLQLANRAPVPIESFPFGAPDAPFEIGVPAGTSVREYFEVLKGWGGDEVARAHLFWTTERTLEAYGRPDEIEEHEDYVEWKYFLSEDEQFDFHFVNGLCVQAH